MQDRTFKVHVNPLEAEDLASFPSQQQEGRPFSPARYPRVCAG